MSRLARAFLINAALLALVIGALWGVNAVVDPYGANRWVDVGLEKHEVVDRLSYFDALVARYRHEQAPVVVVGDSRMDQLTEADLSAAAGQPVINLAAGGARLPEVLAVSRYALEAGEPEHIVVQLNVDLLNGSVRVDRATDARQLLEAPLRYYLHPRISQATALVLWHHVTGAGAVDETPPMDADAFWQAQLDNLGRVQLVGWTYPDDALKKLAELAEDCRERDVELTLVMLPVHEDLRARVVELGFGDHAESLRADLIAIAPLVDFDIDSPLTRDRSRFRDPYHLVRGEDKVVADGIFGHAPELARYGTPQNP